MNYLKENQPTNINDKEMKLRMSNESYVLGRLAINNEKFPYVGETQEAVSRMKAGTDYENTSVVFYIEPISDEPNFLANEININELDESFRHLYVGIDSHHYNTNIEPFGRRYGANNYYKHETVERKKELVYSSLEGKIILFKAKISQENGRNRYYKNINIQDIIEDPNIPGKYVCVPEVNLSNYELESKLINAEPIFLANYTHDMLPPEYLICGEYIYTGFTSWEKDLNNYKTWICSKNPEGITKTNLSFSKEDYDTFVIRKLESIVFIHEDFLYQDIQNKCQLGDSIIEKTSNTEEFIESNQQALNNSNISTISELIYTDTEGEVDFLKNLKNYTLDNNLCYDMSDIVNFHVSIKTNPLTIVAGMSGTGKSQISLHYANVLGLNEQDKTLLFIPVTPSYTEPEDLLGYLNSHTGLYISSETGLVDFLIHAENNPEKLHMVIFDEMNLSQVEHWFAPFISLLELEVKDRKLHLYSDKAICHNNSYYKPSITIGDNIRFIGTVNLDETTKEFSDRLLDRSNLVSLNKKSLKDFKMEKQGCAGTMYDESAKYSLEDYFSWINKEVTVENFTDAEIELLDNLHDLISKSDPQKGVSFRIAEKIVSYINNIPAVGDKEFVLPRSTAFDIEIKQRVLTKIKGPERQFGNLIGKIDLESNEIINSPIYNLFKTEQAQSISSFELTLKDIKRKAKELTIYGYAN